MATNEEQIIHDLVKYMESNCTGRDNAKPREVIRIAMLKYYGHNLSDVSFRALYRKVPFGYLLVSSRHYGYFIAKDLEDLKLFQEEMDSKLKGMMNRKRDITEHFHKKYGDQLSLFG